MTDVPQQDYVKKPYTEEELEKKITQIRQQVTKKLNKWADRLVIAVTTSANMRQAISRIEGEVWTEDGKQWELKNGIRQTVSITQEARMPIWCPKCSKPMNHRFDRKFYNLRNMCFNCNIEWEGEMRLNGTWVEFEKRMMRENEKSFLRDKIQEHMSYLRGFSEPTLYFSDGRYEVLANKSQFEQLFSMIEQDIEFMLSRLAVIQKEEQEEYGDKND
jgi:hypothetical protein